MMRKDSPLLAFYYDRLPSKKDGGDPNQPYHPITNPDGYRSDVSSTLANAIKNQPLKERDDFSPGILSYIPGLSALASGNQPLFNRHEMYGPLGDLYRYYGGLPLKHDVLQYSENKPTKSKDPNAKYISLNRDPEFVKEVFENYQRVSSGKLNPKMEKQINDHTWNVSGYGFNKEYNPKDYQMNPFDFRAKYNFSHTGPRSQHHSNAIGRYTLSKGKDEKGDYISYYDKFDQGTGSGTNYGEMIGLTKPFEIYDRIYVDSKTGKPIVTKKDGGVNTATSLNYHNSLPKVKNGGEYPCAEGETWSEELQKCIKVAATIKHGNETRYYHEPGTGGLNYQSVRTISPYTKNRDIKRYTPVPTSGQDVDFITNYRNFKSYFDPGHVGYNFNPTSVPYEGEKHWNINRFIIDPHLGNAFDDLRASESSMEEKRASILSDMYKYFMLQNPGHKGKSFRQAKRFVRREIDPIMKGAFLNNLYASKKLAPNFNLIDPLNTFDEENPLISTNVFNRGIDENESIKKLVGDQYHREDWTPDKLKDISMDYLRNYKKMSKRDAKKQWKKWEDDAAAYEGNYKYDMSNPRPIRQKVASPKEWANLSDEERFYREQDLPEVGEVGWNVEYFDPITKKTETKHFTTNKEAEQFYNDPKNKVSLKYSDVSSYMHKNGGDISIPDLQESKWLYKYGPGGATTDGCPPYFTKNAKGECVPNFSNFQMPANYSTDKEQVMQPMYKNLQVNESLNQSSTGFNYNDYYNKANKYLSRPIFKGTELKPEHIAKSAQEFYKKTGYEYPLDLLLTQAQLETGLGTKLKSKYNYFNVGNTDSGSIKNYQNPEESLLDYMGLIYNDYLQKGKRNVNDLLKPNGFVNYAGNRYALAPDYEKKLLSQKNFIAKNLSLKEGGLTRYGTGGTKLNTQSCPEGYIRVNSICIPINSDEYREAYNKGLVGEPQSGSDPNYFTSDSMFAQPDTLSEVKVYGKALTPEERQKKLNEHYQQQMIDLGNKQKEWGQFSSDMPNEQARIQQIAEAEENNRRKAFSDKQQFIGPSAPYDPKERYQRNKQYALEHDMLFNYDTGDLADRSDNSATGSGWGRVATPELTQTFAGLTPSGNINAGEIGANTFLNMTPGIGILPASARLATFVNSVGPNPIHAGENAYFSENNSFGENALGALNFVGDVGMLNMQLPKTQLMPGVQQKGFGFGKGILDKFRNVEEGPILGGYRNIEQLRLANRSGELNPVHMDTFGSVENFQKIRNESQQLIKKYGKEFEQKFGKGSNDDVLIYAGLQESKSLPQTSFLQNDKFAKDYGLSNDITPYQKFLGDTYQLEYSGHFNRPQSKFHNFLNDEFQGLITSNKITSPSQVSRAQSFNRPVSALKDGEWKTVNYNDLQVGDIIEPGHNWSTSTDLGPNYWGYDQGNQRAFVNLSPGQSGFRPNMYSGSVFPGEQELVLPRGLRYKVSGIDNTATGGNPRFIFDVANTYKPGGITGDPDKPYNAKTNPDGYFILPNGKRVHLKSKSELAKEKKTIQEIKNYAKLNLKNLTPQSDESTFIIPNMTNIPMADDSNTGLIRQQRIKEQHYTDAWTRTKAEVEEFKKSNPWASNLSDNDIVEKIMMRNENLRKRQESPDILRESGPGRSAFSKAWAIASNPMTALKYKLDGQDIPDYFDKGEKNNLDFALNILNPATYINSAVSVGEAATSPLKTAKTLTKAGINLATNLVDNTNVYNDASNAEALGLLGDVGNMFIAGQAGAFKPLTRAINTSKETGLLSNAWKLNPNAGKIPFVEGKPNWLKGWSKDYSDPTKIDFSGMSKFTESIKGTREAKQFEKLNNWWANLPVEKRLDKALGQYYNDQSRKLIAQAQLKKTGLSKLFDVNDMYRPGTYADFVAPFKNNPNIVFKYGKEPFIGQTEEMVLNNQVFNLADESVGLPFHSQNVGNRVVSLMPKVSGKGSSFGITNTPKYEIPREAAAEMASKLRKLQKLGIYPDWKGNNFMFNPETNKLSVFDLNMAPGENSAFAQRFASGTNKMGENPASIMKQYWNLSAKPPRKINLGNIPEEMGGYEGPSSAMTAEEYAESLKNNPPSGQPQRRFTSYDAPNDTYTRMKSLLEYGRPQVPDKLDFVTNEQLVNDKIFHSEYNKVLKDFMNMGYGAEEATEKAVKKTLDILKNHPDYDFDLGLKSSVERLIRGADTYNPFSKNFRDQFLLSQKPLGSQAKMTLRNSLGMVDDNFDITKKAINVLGDKTPGFDEASSVIKNSIKHYEDLLKVADDPKQIEDIQNRIINLYKKIPNTFQGKPYTGVEAFNQIKPNKYGGSIDQYKPGGETTDDDKPKKTILKNRRIGETFEPVSFFNSRPIYSPDTYITENIYDPTCTDPDGLGCSYQATRNAMNITHLPLQSYAPANAGYRDAVAEREGLQNIFNQEGKQKTWAESGNAGWKYPTVEDFKKWKAGDIVVLDAAGLDYFPYNAPPGFTEKDNSGASHNGVVVGFTEEGFPIIKHGYATGKNKGRVITEVLGKGLGKDERNNTVYRNWNDSRVSSLGHGRYAVKSVWRPKEIKDNDLIESIKYINETGEERAARKEATDYPAVFGLNRTYEEQLQSEAPVAAAFSGATARLNTKKALVNLFNDKELDKEIQYQLGLDSKTLQNFKPVIFGIAGQESTFDDVDSIKASAKDIPGNLANLSNSKGLFQIKYDSLTDDERSILGIKSPNDLLDTKTAYKAALLMMSHAKNRMDLEVEQGTHPGLKKADPYFRAAYYYNSPARAISTAKEWGKGRSPFVVYDPETWLNPFFDRDQKIPSGSIDPNYANKIELRMDEGSYPDKIMKLAKDLFMDNSTTETTPETMEPVVVRSLKNKNKKVRYYND